MKKLTRKEEKELREILENIAYNESGIKYMNGGDLEITEFFLDYDEDSPAIIYELWVYEEEHKSCDSVQLDYKDLLGLWKEASEKGRLKVLLGKFLSICDNEVL